MNPYEPEFVHVYDWIANETPNGLADDTEMGFMTWGLAQATLPEVRTILDVGCGKGRFLIPLAQRGYQLTGLDISPEMLAGCQTRLDQFGLQVTLIQADLETMAFDRQFDALICMDSVICYLLETERIIQALKRFRQVLRPGGVLILNIWNILAQWETFGKTLTYTQSSGRTHAEWSEHALFESFDAILRTDYAGYWEENGTNTPFRHQEVMRAMTSGEVIAYLTAAGFTRVKAYPGFDRGQTDPKDPEELLFLAG